ncbi:hypothetical protein N624_2864 [Levilactobacillus brevis]|nr:hypothetical protein N624_2864 [Levilactobacillus brevis]
MENQTVPIFYAVDDNYAPYLAVSLASLVAHTSPDRHYQVIVLCDDLNTDNQGRLKAFETDNLKIQFVSINDRLKQEITDKNNKLRSDYFTFTIYFRLFIAELFPKLDKALYLDADTVVLKDVGELFDTQLGDTWLAQCRITSSATLRKRLTMLNKPLGLIHRNTLIPACC